MWLGFLRFPTFLQKLHFLRAQVSVSPPTKKHSPTFGDIKFDSQPGKDAPFNLATN